MLDLVASLVLLAPPADGFMRPFDQRVLPIPDRPWAPGAPPEGWCGEASLQMVALHFGAWIPQRAINALGRSTHVDLWETDLPVTMERLGLSFETFTAMTRTPRAELLTWIVSWLRRGVPVIVGAKLMPTEHPEWEVDHLMPVVGFSPTHLLFNSNTEAGRVEVPWEALLGRPTDGISFEAPKGALFAWAVTGFRDGSRAPALQVVRETRERVELRASGALDVERRSSVDGGVTVTTWSGSLTVGASEWVRLRPAAKPGAQRDAGP
jgi:hypothetical protein